MNKNIISQTSPIETIKPQLKLNKTVSVGQRFGKLVVKENLESDKGGKRVRCQCDCGSFTDVYRAKLLAEAVKSCGCLRKEMVRERRTSHGYSSRTSPHYGLYKLWQRIKNRCKNANSPIYKYYGGRGISVDPNWENPKNFIDYILEHVGLLPTPKHSIDRIDNEGNYEPGNVRFATQSEQMNNTRRSNKNKVSAAV